MNWLKTLLRKPAATPIAPVARQKPPVRAIPPAVDIEQLRRDLAGADAEARGPAAQALGEALAALTRQPDSGDAAEVWVAAIGHLADKEMALAWLDQLSGDAWLGELAARARNAEVRFAAARRIEDAAVLERVAQASRD